MEQPDVTPGVEQLVADDRCSALVVGAEWGSIQVSPQWVSHEEAVLS